MSEHQSITVQLTNSKGLHARAAAKFVKTSETFNADITVARSGMEVSGLSIMGLMMLAARCGTQVTIKAEGLEADAALQALVALVEGKFGEE